MRTNTLDNLFSTPLKRTQQQFKIALFCALMGTYQAASADAQVRYNNGNEIQTAFVKNGQVLIKNANDQNTDMLFDSASKTMTVIQHAEKKYMRLDAATIKQLTSQLSGIQTAIQQQLANLPPEQRDQLAAMMGGLGNTTEPEATGKVTIKDTGSGSANGFACQQKQVFEGDAVVGKLCTAKASSLKISKPDYQTLVNMQTFMLSMAQQAKQSMGNLGKQIPNFGGAEIDQLVVQGIMNDTPENTLSIESTTANNVVVSMVVPKGYTQQDTSSLSSLMAK